MRFVAPIFLRSRTRLLSALGAVLAFVFFAGPVLADDQPFDLESSSWMSFDRYKDKPANWLTPDQRTAVAAQPVVIAPPTLPASLPVMSDPTRPVIAPVMPGLNKNFDIRVDSTEDDHALSVIQADEKEDQQIGMPGNEWKDAVETARTSKTIKGDNGSGSFNVRYTALPTWMKTGQKKAPAMTPVPAAIPPVKIAQPIAPAPVPPPAPAASPADVAACAALDAYKKRQLAAIESDRQTLSALQGAIAQLGLQKQLDFMPGVGGSLNAQTAGPVSSAVPAKN